MSVPAAIAGTFSKVLPVQSRGIVQFVIEVPVERAHEAVGMLGGYPQPGQQVWVAIARLRESPRSAHPTGEGAAAKEATPVRAERGKRKWADMKWVERFGILCEDPQFQHWCNGEEEGLNVAPVKRWDGQHYLSADYAASFHGRVPFAVWYVRWWCGVASRKDIDGNPEAEARAAILYNEFDAYRGRTGKPA